MDSTLMKDVKDILALLTPVATAYIIYMQIKAGQKTKSIQETQKEIEKKVDGMTSKLVEAEKGKADAVGQLKGLAQAKADMVIPVVPLTDVKVSLKEEVVKKVADTVVEKVKSDPDIEVKKVSDT